jgi:hypothetical protein
MDWQPEDQIVIPQCDNTIYTYGKGTEQQEVSGDAREGVREGKFGPNPSMRHRAASDVGVQAVQAILQQPSGVVHRDDVLNPSPYRL